MTDEEKSMLREALLDAVKRYADQIDRQLIDLQLASSIRAQIDERIWGGRMSQLDQEHKNMLGCLYRLRTASQIEAEK